MYGVTASIAQPVISSVEKSIRGRGVRRTGTGHMDRNF